MSEQLPTEITSASRLRTAAEFHRLADVPPEVEWFANLRNPSTRRAYENAVRDFMRFTGIGRPEEFRTVTWGAYHRVARRPCAARARWQHHPAPAGVAVRIFLRQERHHPQPGQRRRAAEDGKRRRQDPCPWRSQSAQAAGGTRDDTIKSKRDRAILSTLLFHALRREELCKLKVKDFRHARKGVPDRQGRQDAVSPAASRHQRPHQ
jgi:hypothetical protein